MVCASFFAASKTSFRACSQPKPTKIVLGPSLGSPSLFVKIMLSAAAGTPMVVKILDRRSKSCRRRSSTSVTSLLASLILWIIR